MKEVYTLYSYWLYVEVFIRHSLMVLSVDKK